MAREPWFADHWCSGNWANELSFSFDLNELWKLFFFFTEDALSVAVNANFPSLDQVSPPHSPKFYFIDR